MPLMPSEPVSDPGFVAVPLAHGLDPSLEEWEKATAVVLRKSRRLAEDAPDSDVWSVLSTTTLDGISVTPLGTAELVEPRAGSAGPGSVHPRIAPQPTSSTGGTTAPGSPILMLSARQPTSPPTWRTASTRCGSRSAPAARRSTLWPRSLNRSSSISPLCVSTPRTSRSRRPRHSRPSCAPRPSSLHPARTLGVDPIGASLRGVGSTRPRRSSAGPPRSRKTSARAPITVDATAAHDAGASDAQELAYSLAAGVTYLRLLVDAGVAVDAAAELIDFRYAATDQQFPTIAKFRAARRLWNRVLELSGVTSPVWPAAARRHVSSDDVAVRPVREHAAHHGRGIRGRSRWRLRRHGAALRRAARPARGLQPPHRAQHLQPADRRVARRHRHRRCRRCLRGREADRRPRPHGVGRCSARSTPPPMRRRPWSWSAPASPSRWPPAVC